MQYIPLTSFDTVQAAEATPLRRRAVGVTRHRQALPPSGGQGLHITHRIGRLGPLVADATDFGIGGEQSACEDPALFRQPCGLGGTDSRKRLEDVVQATPCIQTPGQMSCIFQRLARTLPRSRQRRMRGIANQQHIRPAPCMQRLQVMHRNQPDGILGRGPDDA